MSLEIISVHGQGDHEMEHVLMKARVACSIARFLLADGRHTEDTDDTAASSQVRHTYWFPDTKVNAGDYVTLWTKAGKNTVGEMNDGTPVHRFFWNLAAPVWNEAGDCAILFDLRNWQCFRVHAN